MKEKITKDTKKARDFFLEKISFLTGPFELKEKIQNDIEDINIIDVRRYEDYIEGHIPFAIHVPFDSLEEHLVMFEKDKVNIVYCYSAYCKLGAKAAYMIADKGYPVMLLEGGYLTWQKLGYDCIKTSGDTDN